MQSVITLDFGLDDLKFEKDNVLVFFPPFSELMSTYYFRGLLRNETQKDCKLQQANQKFSIKRNLKSSRFPGIILG